MQSRVGCCCCPRRIRRRSCCHLQNEKPTTFALPKYYRWFALYRSTVVNSNKQQNKGRCFPARAQFHRFLQKRVRLYLISLLFHFVGMRTIWPAQNSDDPGRHGVTSRHAATGRFGTTADWVLQSTRSFDLSSLVQRLDIRGGISEEDKSDHAVYLDYPIYSGTASKDTHIWDLISEEKEYKNTHSCSN